MVIAAARRVRRDLASVSLVNIVAVGILIAGLWPPVLSVRGEGPPPAPASTEPAKVPVIDESADRTFRAACKYLADAKAFSVKAEVWEDVVLPNGQKIQTTKTLDIQEQRPDQLHIEVRSPHFSRGFWYRNKTLTMLARTQNLYGVMDVPENIDKMIDTVEDRFGIELPLADVLVADPYRNVMDIVTSSDDLGKATVLGVPCQHLAFTSEAMDCQIWFADGPKPLPRKIVINQKTKVGSPQITAIFSDWDLVSPIAESSFVFAPPAGACKIDVNPRKPAEDPDAAPPTSLPATDNAAGASPANK